MKVAAGAAATFNHEVNQPAEIEMLPATADARTSRAWRIAVLVTTLLSVGFSLSNQSLGLPGRSIAEISDLYPSLLRPAGYAFSIWSLIYAAQLAYAACALRPAQRSVRMHDRVAPWLILSNLLGPAWIISFRQNATVLAAALILGYLAVAAVMFLTVNIHVQLQRLNALWRAPFALLFGWLFTASLSAISIALVALGLRGSAWTEATAAVALLGGAGFLAWFCAAQLGDPIVPLVIAWATTAVAVRNFQLDSAWVAWVALLIAVGSLVLGASSTARGAAMRRYWRRGLASFPLMPRLRG